MLAPATAKVSNAPAAVGAERARASELPDADSVPRFGWPVVPLQTQWVQKPAGGAGLLLTGTLGQSVKAAAAGRVVYAGMGLARSYGAVVIVKHSDSWLSAYGYNQQISVKENDWVSANQVLARMGDNGQGRAQLYFEIRHHGKPVNPMDYLPSAVGASH